MKKKKKSEIAEQIDGLMKAKSLGQAGLAHEIDVSPSRISEWLAGKRSPSSDALWKLGKLAPSPQNLWFWERAGLTRDAILSAAAKIEREQARDVASEIAAGNAVSIAPLAEFNDGSMSDLVLPRRCVANAASVRYLAVNEGFAFGAIWKPYLRDSRAGRIDGLSKDIEEMARQVAIEMANSREPIPPFELGDVLLVDVSKSDSVDLMPFWGETILFGTGLRTQAYIVGQLGLQRIPRLGFEARLYYWTTFEGGETYDVASWRAEKLDGASDQDDFPEAVEDEAEARARKELRLAKGQRIFGIVRGWLSLSSIRS